MIEINTKENKMILSFSDKDPFDVAILEKIQDGFVKLSPDDYLYVDARGMIPIEVSAYLIEVSNHCNMTLTVFDDERCFTFMQQFSQSTSSNIKLEFKGERNGS